MLLLRVRQAVSVNDNEPETFRSSRSRTGRGRQGGNGV